MKLNRKPNAVELTRALKAKCLDCSSGVRNEVRNCKVENCPLWNIRAVLFAKNETEISETDDEQLRIVI